MYDKHEHKDKPPKYLWRCVKCAVLYGNHDYESDHGVIWRQRWEYKGQISKWPYYTHTLMYGCQCESRHTPPSGVLRNEHKRNRQHVRRTLKEYEGPVDWDMDYIEPTNVTGPNSAWWAWY